MNKVLSIILLITVFTGLTVVVFAENAASDLAETQSEQNVSPLGLSAEERSEQHAPSEPGGAVLFTLEESTESEANAAMLSSDGEVWDIGVAGSLTAESGTDYIITGTTNANIITIPSGYSGTITLDGVAGKAMNIAAGSNVNLVLQGTNSFAPTVVAETAITVGGTLTISGSGSLTVNPIQNGGSIYVPTGGTLIINDGTIVANGSNHAAGIGGKRNMSAGVGTIIINGGNVTANGGGRWSGCAGIGTGIPNPGNDSNSTGGTIIINGGTVNATGGYSDGASAVGGAGIGMGRVVAGGINMVAGQKIIITGGNITAAGGLNASAIGADDDNSVKTNEIIILPGANIVSLTSDNAPLIGEANSIFYLNEAEINDIDAIGSDTAAFIVKATDAAAELEAFADFSAYNAVLAGTSPFSLGTSEADTPTGQIWNLQYYTDMTSSGTGNVVFSADGYADKQVPVDELEMGDGAAFVFVLGGSGDSVEQSETVGVTPGMNVRITASVSNVMDIDDKIFELTYDDNLMEIDDLALQTADKDQSVGVLSGYPLEIIAISAGKVKFKYTQSANNKNFSGVISIITLKGIGTGQSEISLSMY